MSLTLLGAMAVAGAGLAAGTVNAVVGSGSLITFPTLLGLGYPSVTANVSNTFGLAFGGVSGVYGYRAELAAHRPAIRGLLGWSVTGGLAGAVALLTLPGGVFAAVVPALILLSVALVIAAPTLAGRLAGRGDGPPGGAWWLKVSVALTGVYGGYFGAAQGVLLIGLLGIGLPMALQESNGVKNLLATSVNLVSALLFVALGRVAWEPALLILGGSLVGGALGARYGRRLPSSVLRWGIVVVGTGVALRLLLT